MDQRQRLSVHLKSLAMALCIAAACAAAFNWWSVRVAATATFTPDTKGTDFWLAFNQNFSPAAESTRPIALTLFITGDTATTATVDIPGIVPPFSETFTVTPGLATTVAIPSVAQMISSDVVEAKGIHVTAGAEVTVYGLNRRSQSTDAYLGLPTDILGTEYINLGYANDIFFPVASNRTQFGIVGTEDATVVTITPSVTVAPHPANVPYTITLNTGQTYQIGTSVGGLDLSGTIITATHPVGVFGSHSCAEVPQDVSACDHVVEQIPPTSTWGKNFVTMPLATRTKGDTFRFLASQDGTEVRVNGVLVATLNRGKLFQQNIKVPSQVTSDKPILVAQYSNGTSFDGVTSDPFMVLVPPYEQFQASYTVTTPPSGFTSDFINIVVPTVGVSSLALDGTSISPGAIVGGSFTQIGTGPFSAAQVIVTSGAHTLDGGNYPFGITVYGFAAFDSYGYPGGMALAPIAVVATLTLIPPDAFNPLNTEHCVTATVLDQLDHPVVGVRVDFKTQGVHEASGFSNTDALGHARFCYTGTVVGTDGITATQGTLTATATKTWVALVATQIAVAPKTGLDFVGTEHCVTATVLDQIDRVLAGVTVDFTVTRSNSASGSGITDNNGQAEFCYVGLHAGDDDIVATAGSVSDAATETWQVPVIDAVNDAGTSLNGFVGGTSFTNVIANDTLNAVPVTLSTVTLAFVSSTNPGVTLSGNNVMVAAGTAAGDYQLVYQICEVLNPTNCDSATVTVPVTPAPIDAVNDSGTPVNGFVGGTSFTNVLANDTLNGAAVVPSAVALTFVSSTNGGVTLSGSNVVVAAGTAAGDYELIYKICEVLNPTNCDSATVTAPVTPAPIDAVNDAGTPVNGLVGGTSFTNVLANDTLNGVPVTPSAVALSFVSSTNGGVTLAGSDVVVAAGTPAGEYELVYKICEGLNPANCDSATVAVPVTAAGSVIDAVNDSGSPVNGSVGGTSFTNVLANDTLNGVPVTPGTVTLAFVSSTNGGVTLAGTNVVVAAGTPDGNYQLIYMICEVVSPTNCDSATVTVPVTDKCGRPDIDAVNDRGIPVNGAVGGTSFTNVLRNDTLNGAPATLGTVALAFVSSTNGGVTLSGTNVVVAAGTPDGNYQLVYRICEVANPTNCDSATVTVPITEKCSRIDAVNDRGTPVNGVLGGTSFTNVLANDTLNGAPATLATVTLALVSSTNARVTLSGRNVVVAAGTPVGNYQLVYRICETANPTNCDSATVTVPVTGTCVRERDYWLDHPEEWPVASLRLGSVTYSRAQLLRILQYAARSGGWGRNGLTTLASDLIVARLNQAEGALVPTAVGAALAAADALIGGNIPPPIGANSLSPGAVSALDALLDAYNSGASRGGPPSCRDCKDDRRHYDKDGGNGNDGKDRRDGRNGSGRGGDDDHQNSYCGGGKGHHDDDDCVSGHHGHTDGDRCHGSDGVHHDGDGCDARNSSHGQEMKKDSRKG